MEQENFRKVLEKIKIIAPEGVQLHQKYGWGGFLDVFEKNLEKNKTIRK